MMTEAMWATSRTKTALGALAVAEKALEKATEVFENKPQYKLEKSEFLVMRRRVTQLIKELNDVYTGWCLREEE